MKSMYRNILLIGILVHLSSLIFAATGRNINVNSPNGKTCVELKIDSDSKLYYQISVDGSKIIFWSRFGIVADGTDLGASIRFGIPTKHAINETYPVFGVHANAINNYNEAIIPVERENESYFLDVRAFDSGIALRCRLIAKKGRHIQNETSEWRLPLQSVIWHQDELDGYEGIYTKTRIDTLSSDKIIALPVTAVLPNGKYCMITEANLVNYSELAIRLSKDKSLKTFYHADSIGWKTDAEVIQPWRVTLVAKDLNELVNNDIIRNLCPAPTSQLANASWIKPGRSTWQWWSSGAPKYEEQRQWVDWTHQLGFEYYLVDAGWKEWQDSIKNCWTCLAEVTAYAKTVDVGIWLWVNSNEIADKPSRKAYFEKAKKAGVIGVKIDFIPPASCHWVNWYDATLRDAANLQLMVDFHGANKPTGRDRTWPNELTREGIRGHEWHILRYNRTLPPYHDCVLPFTRYVQGSADYTPTVFNSQELRGYTWARELAQAIVFTSPFLCYADNPKNYIENPAVDILKAIPSTWDKTIVLAGSEIGKCAAFARQKGNVWYIGILNGGESTDIDISLGFLDGGSYQMITLEDKENIDDSYSRNTKEINNSGHITLTIRPKGGFVAQLIKH